MSIVNTKLMLMIFSIGLVQYKTQHLHFKVFLTIYMYQFGWLFERGVFKFASEGGGYPEKVRGRGGGGFLRKGGVPTLVETMNLPAFPIFLTSLQD